MSKNRPFNGRSYAESDNHGKRIGILVVTYNAVTTIAQVLRRVPEDVWARVEEVLVMDDASADSTYELATGLKILRGLEKLTVLKNETNRGYGGNQKLGYQYFMQKGFDVVVLLHGDGQYAPELLADMYAPIVAGEADAVFGSRMMRAYGGALRGGMPMYKYTGNRILTKLENRALGMELTEFHSGYRAYSLAALREIRMEQMTDDFHYDTEIIIKLHHQGFRIKEIPIPTYYGDEICYVNGMKYAWNVVRSVKRFRRTTAGLACAPEFAEYFVHYPEKTSRYSSHYYLRLWMGKNQDVLDVGTGDGHMARALNEAGNRVVGLDLLGTPAHRENFDQYLQCDVDNGLDQAIDRLQGKKFDTVVLFDILEHVRNSDKLLRDCHQLLKPGGRLLVSMPNVANIYVRLGLLFGSFEHADRGILDRTHVRFFTRRSAAQLLRTNGFVIKTQEMTVMPVEALGLRPQGFLGRSLTRILAALTWAMPGLFGYQTLFVAQSSELARKSQPSPPLASPA